LLQSHWRDRPVLGLVYHCLEFGRAIPFGALHFAKRFSLRSVLRVGATEGYRSEIRRVRWLGVDRRRTAALQATCGSARYRDDRRGTAALQATCGSARYRDDRRGTAAQQATCGSARYREAVTAVPATGRAKCSELHRATSATLPKGSQPMVHLTEAV
jgi:hypothetical protein